MSRTQRLVVGLGLLVSIVFLWLAFSRLDLAAMWSHIQEANIPLVLVGAVIYMGGIAVMSLRWGFLLRSLRPVPLRELFELVSIGYMGNNVYPFRSGEVVRVWLLQRNQGIPIARGLTTAIVERIFDGLVMLTFIVVSLLVLEITSPEIRDVLALAAPIFLIGIAVFFVLAARPNLLRGLVGWIARRLPERLSRPILHLTEEFLGGIAGLRSPADLAGTVITSYLAWMIKAFVFWLIGLAFNLDINYFHALLACGVVNLAGLIPASPGQLGVFEFFTALVLIAAGIEEAPATAYALVLHAVVWLPVTLLGFYFLARQGLNWSAISRARSSVDSTPVTVSK